jgi:selenobiotic family peptide radical SAM maturase
VPQEITDRIEEIYPACRKLVASEAWDRLANACATGHGPGELPQILSRQGDILSPPGYLPELARLEWTLFRVKTLEPDYSPRGNQIEINPSLQLLRLSWKNLTFLLTVNENDPVSIPEFGEEYVLVWRHPRTHETLVCPATDEDLLVLKMAAEEIDLKQLAAAGEVTIHALDAAIDRAVGRGLLIAPPSGIRRDPSCFLVDQGIEEDFLSSPVFTLQWHITQACDLHCRHCYDRSHTHPLELGQSIKVLDGLHEFCRSRKVKGQVSFTGGNPLLYPDFLEVYRAASGRGFSLAILGNPAPREVIEELIAIEPPLFYQVSLEGLREHNDHIRGPGHFDRVLEFLRVLRHLDIYSMVMLTLTRNNLSQVLPLAEMLRRHTDLFSFSRLSLVGEGAALRLPTKDDYRGFLEAYSEAAERNPVCALKDNLLNIIRYQKGLPAFGGCAGYGCGAAFNFVSLLADGSVHACRKFPSLIGNILHASLDELYDSEPARRYRTGSRACRSCAIRPVCGGCLAISHSFGLDLFVDRDPYCFMTE